MTDVTPNLKPVGTCGCGCGREGTLRVKPWRDGTVCVTRGCDCARCRGKRNKRLGQRKQARAVSALGVPRSSLHPGHEEFLGGTVRVEVKSGTKHADPVWTKYRASEAQSEAQRPVGDHRPFVALFMPADSSDGLVVFRLSRLDETLMALAEQRGLVA